MFNLNVLPLRCCNNCQGSSSEFKEAVNLKKSFLTIYVHEDKSKKIKIGDDDRRSIILHNTGDRELKRFDFIVELCRYKTKCISCTAIIQRVRNLLEDITSIKKHQVLGICECCKHSNNRKKCKRCDYVVNKFINYKAQQSKDHEDQLISLLLKAQRVLISIMQGRVTCKHNTLLDDESKMNLDSVLQYLNSSLSVKQPNIEIYPNMICLQSSENDNIKSKQILDALLLKLKSVNKKGFNVEQTLNDSLSESESFCICKQLKKDKSSPPLPETLSNDFIRTTNLNDVENDFKNESRSVNKGAIKQNIYKTDDQTDKSKQLEKKNEFISHIKNQIGDNENKVIKKHVSKYKNDNKSKFLASQKTYYNIKKLENEEVERRDSFNHLMIKLIKEKNKEKLYKVKYTKQEKNIPPRVIGDLPNIKTTMNTIVNREDAESIVECNGTPDHAATKMIKGNIIVRNDYHRKDNSEMKIPLFKTLAECTAPVIESTRLLLEDNSLVKEKSIKDEAGVIFYKLSDRKFIENGWTQLPMTKIMRRMNIYKTITSNDVYDWFKCRKSLFYQSGVKLAEVAENGSGKWFYENGDIALDYCNVTGDSSGRMYIIYSSSEDNNIVNKKKTTVLGCFDSLGNGVVYDHCGNARLKYNQSEGMVIDKTVGPPGRWKWHGLNEPPDLQLAYLDTKVAADPCLRNVVEETDIAKKPNERMIAIEYEKFLKARATKTFKNYKPFEVTIKAIKLNNRFSLRIVSQSKINLLFRYGHHHLKQNMGISLKCDEIVDTVMIELGDVSTPYDRQLPKPESTGTIQKVLL